jgi:hypothetical protein
LLTEVQSSPVPAVSQVGREVRKQHQLLRAVLATAEAAARKDGENRLEVAHIAHEVRRRFRAHLTFEERVLVPVLTCIEVWGPDRVRDLVSEHARQRADLDALVQGIELGWDRATVARAVQALAADLLRDMEEEERDYLGPELLRD